MAPVSHEARSVPVLKRPPLATTAFSTRGRPGRRGRVGGAHAHLARGAALSTLYVVRHAIAEPQSPGGTDAARALTPEGRARFAEAVRGLRRLDVRVDLLLHSPWRRAAETAALLAELCDGPVEPCAELAEAPSRALLSRLRAGRVAVVGHEPWVGELVGWLVFGTPTAALPQKKGGVAWLEGDMVPGGMRLYAMIPPRVTTRLGG